MSTPDQIHTEALIEQDIAGTPGLPGHAPPGSPHCHQPTKDYAVRRTAEGRNKKEILRCLKRCIAREINPRLLSPASLGGRQR